MKLTVACVFVTGHVPFNASYVTRLKSMASKRLPAHEFVCLTNREHELPADVKTIHVDPPRNSYAWWAKLNLFRKDIGLSGRVLYLDLDVLLVNDLLPIVDYPAEFALIPDGAPGFKPKGRWQCVKRFNSSVMIFEAGAHHRLFAEWNSFVALRLWGDQDWIGEQAKDATTMPLDWFPRLSEVPSGVWSREAKVILCKKPKNSVAALSYPWFKEAWQ